MGRVFGHRWTRACAEPRPEAACDPRASPSPCELIHRARREAFSENSRCQDSMVMDAFCLVHLMAPNQHPSIPTVKGYKTRLLVLRVRLEVHCSLSHSTLLSFDAFPLHLGPPPTKDSLSLPGGKFMVFGTYCTYCMHADSNITINCYSLYHAHQIHAAHPLTPRVSVRIPLPRR